MATPEGDALTRLAERIDLLNRELTELSAADASEGIPAGLNTELRAALSAIQLTLDTHTRSITALMDVANMLAGQIDRLRHELEHPKRSSL